VEAVTVGQYALVAAVAFLAATLAGVSGYGTGIILPLVLVPIIGAEATVPVMGVASFFTNSSRLAAFWRDFDRRRAALIVVSGIPTCILGAYAYTLLTGRGASLVIGLALVLLVPGRRLMMKARGSLSIPSIAAAGAGFGLLDGGAPGVGVVLISILLAAGLNGSAVIATDAGVSLVLAAVKTAVFQSAGALTPASWLIALLVGAVSLPAAFLARWIVPLLPSHAHILVLDGVVLLGGAMLIVRSFA
jgi:uncharacterized membrane protein YfcA